MAKTALGGFGDDWFGRFGRWLAIWLLLRWFRRRLGW